MVYYRVHEAIKKLNAKIAEASEAQASVDLQRTNVESMNHRNKMFREMSDSLTEQISRLN